MEKFQAFRCFREEKKVYGKLTEITMEDLDPGDLVIETKYFSVNFKDALGGTGKRQIFKKWLKVRKSFAVGSTKPWFFGFHLPNNFTHSSTRQMRTN